MRAVVQRLQQGSLTPGPTCERIFPEDGNVVFTNCGKTAIETIVRREGLAGKTILLPALIIRDCFEKIFEKYGIEPIFADVNPRTYHMDFDEARRKVDDVDAVLLLHTYGVPADASQWRRLAAKHDVLLIEDCARALGATVDGRPVGSFGDFAVFSLHKVTPLVEGGALVGRVEGTELDRNEITLAHAYPVLPDSLRSAAASGYRYAQKLVGDSEDGDPVEDWDHSLHRLDGLNEHLLYYHLEFGFENRVRRNVELARRIRSSLEPLGFEFQSIPRGTCPFHFVSISAPRRRDEIVERLRSAGLPVTTLWKSPLPTAYAEPRRIADRYPRTKTVMESGLQLPLVEMDDADVTSAIEAITDVAIDSTS